MIATISLLALMTSYAGGHDNYTCPQVTHKVVASAGQAPDRYQCAENMVYIPEYIKAGQQVNRGEGIISENQKYVAEVQSDNNICVYEIDWTGNHVGAALWCSGTHEGTYNRVALFYQADNNICVYPVDEDDADVGAASWCSMSVSTDTAGALIMQNDGNLCAYEDDDTNPTNFWCSNTAQGLIPIFNAPDPFGTISVSVTFISIISIMMVAIVGCLLCYVIAIRKKNGSFYGKVALESDTELY